MKCPKQAGLYRHKEISGWLSLLALKENQAANGYKIYSNGIECVLKSVVLTVHLCEHTKTIKVFNLNGKLYICELYRMKAVFLNSFCRNKENHKIENREVNLNR